MDHPEDIKYIAEPTLELFHNDDSLVRGIRSNVGSGKTSTCCVEICLRAVTQEAYHGVRYSRWALVRNTFPQLVSTTLETWNSWFGHWTKIKMASPITGLMLLELPDKTLVHLELWFIALDRPDDLKKFKGLELTGVLLNEVVELPREVLIKALERRGRYPSKRRGGASWSGVIMDTNSCSDRHWWYNAAEVTRPKGWSFYSQPSALLKFTERELVDKYLDLNIEYFNKINTMQGGANVSLIQPEDLPVIDEKGNCYIPNPAAENVSGQALGWRYWLDMISGSPVDYISVFVMNEYGTIVSGMPVYPEYQDSKHCSKVNLETYPNIGLTMGYDYGLSPACTFSQLSPKGQKRVFDELITEEHGGMGIRQFSRKVVIPHLIENYLDFVLKGIIQSYGDPAGNTRAQTDETTCIQIMNERLFPNNTIQQSVDAYLRGEEISLADLGIITHPARTNSFTARKDAVARLLLMDLDGEPGLLISPKCSILRSGMRGHYCYKLIQASGDSRYKMEPDKDDISSHVNDGLQYDCLMSTPMVYDEAGSAEAKRREKIISTLDNTSLRAMYEIEEERRVVIEGADSMYGTYPM